MTLLRTLGRLQPIGVPSSPISKKIAGLPVWLRARLAARTDSEHEMSVNRLVFLLLMVLYLWAAPVAQQRWALIAMGCGLIVTLGIFAHLLWRPATNNVRRAIALCADLSTINLMMYFGDSAGMLFYPLLLWTVLGNGFRFGIRWLASAGIVAMVLFLSVALATPFLRANPFLASGLAVGLVIIPAYAAVLIRKLNDARQLAEQASAAKTMFLATVSHQLRTPLNAIRGAHDTLFGSTLSSDQREMLGIARDGAEILLSNIEELIDFSQIESGHLKRNPVTFELLPLLNEVLNIARTLAQDKPVRLTLHVDARCPLRLHGERRYLREILQNLVSNAVKFTHEGGVLIAVQPSEFMNGTCRIQCEVVDTGIGIAPEALDRIFDSFVQANERILDEYGGTGLGLAICRRLASALSGSIAVASAVGEGSKFRVDGVFEIPPPVEAAITNARLLVIDETGANLVERLRRIAPEQLANVDFVKHESSFPTVAVLSDPEALIARSSNARLNIKYGDISSPADSASQMRDLRWHCASQLSIDFTAEDWINAVTIAQFPQHNMVDHGGTIVPFPAKHRGIRVLIADDNKSNQKVTAKLLETAGFDVAFAGNGDDALEIMDSGSIDIVLMDVNMPVLNGLEATKHYRMAALDLPHLPIIGLTADATARMEGRCLDAGMDACLTKPIDARRLLSVLEQFIGASGTTAKPIELECSTISPIHQNSEDPINEVRLRELEALGGTEFIRDMLHTLLSDLETLTIDLRRAQGEDDLYRFRDVAHSIRSCAANVGADPLRRQAERLEYLPAQAFAQGGAVEIRSLMEQTTRLRGEITRRLAH
jgi:two-component system sensor histidine kinase RpfC